jgi:hypothetical protein
MLEEGESIDNRAVGVGESLGNERPGVGYLREPLGSARNGWRWSQRTQLIRQSGPVNGDGNDSGVDESTSRRRRRDSPRGPLEHAVSGEERARRRRPTV